MLWIVYSDWRFQPLEDAQSKFNCARIYKNHLANMSRDRKLEEYLQVRCEFNAALSPFNALSQYFLLAAGAIALG